MTEHATEFFVELERKVWQALVDGDRDADTAALSEDFLGVYPSGLAGRADHADQVRDGPTVLSYSIDEAQIRVVTNDHVLLIYRAKLQRPKFGPAAWWVHRCGRFARANGRTSSAKTRSLKSPTSQ